MIGKLLGLATVGSTLAGVGMLHRFLSSIASVIMLAIVSAFMLCALLAGGFYIAYVGLTHYGLDPTVAGLTVGGIALIATAALVALTFARLRQLHGLSRHSLNRHPSAPLDIGPIANAFVDGFLNHKD